MKFFRNRRSLRSHAARLAVVLAEMLRSTETYARMHPDFRPAREWSADLRPLVAEFNSIVESHGNRVQAAELLYDVKVVMVEIGAVQWRGERRQILRESSNSTFWDLHTVFRETRYSDQDL